MDGEGDDGVNWARFDEWECVLVDGRGEGGGRGLGDVRVFWFVSWTSTRR